MVCDPQIQLFGYVGIFFAVSSSSVYVTNTNNTNAKDFIDVGQHVLEVSLASLGLIHSVMVGCATTNVNQIKATTYDGNGGVLHSKTSGVMTNPRVDQLATDLVKRMEIHILSTTGGSPRCVELNMHACYPDSAITQPTVRICRANELRDGPTEVMTNCAEQPFLFQNKASTLDSAFTSFLIEEECWKIAES
ncbi:unnamed protein product [Didymodactylos carnosus]|uniref:Uncharacterized protein n=1 Tax=Didymodactylos carnosus TaxID=1234261 RepID=A0A815KJM1_9BILA|nr:unnamed protein product [Didymodactylos carnosus]CAF4288390.1 unnamed protein product [Didymodactylos carnosus]